jgi:hypothetical protein
MAANGGPPVLRDCIRLLSRFPRTTVSQKLANIFFTGTNSEAFVEVFLRAEVSCVNGLR